MSQRVKARKRKKPSSQTHGPAQTRTERAGLTLSVGVVNDSLADRKADENANVYMAAVLEYLTTEVLELAGDEAKRAIQPAADTRTPAPCITPQHISTAMANDQEFKTLLFGRAKGPDDTKNARKDEQNLVKAANDDSTEGTAVRSTETTDSPPKLEQQHNYRKTSVQSSVCDTQDVKSTSTSADVAAVNTVATTMTRIIIAPAATAATSVSKVRYDQR